MITLITQQEHELNEMKKLAKKMFGDKVSDESGGKRRRE
jgi:hypothetical protein